MAAVNWTRRRPFNDRKMHSMARALGRAEHAELRAMGVCNHQNKLKLHHNTFKSTFQSLPDVQIQFRDKFSLSTFRGEFKFHIFKPIQGYAYFHFSFFLYYTYIYTPSNQHFKAFPVSKINSETSFLYQLFKDNSNFIVWKPCKFTYLSAFYDFCY